MIDVMIFVPISIIPLIGSILNIYSSKRFLGEGKLAMLKVISILKATINIVFILAWLSFFYWHPVLSIPLFFFSGILLLALSYLLFILVHDQIYVKRGAGALTSIALPVFLLYQTGVEEYREMITNSYAIGLGFILAINLLTVMYAFQLYREMKGGALIWLYLAIYTASVFLTSTLNVIATFHNVAGVITDIDSFIISSVSLIIPDAIIVVISNYYVKVILPLLKEIS